MKRLLAEHRDLGRCAGIGVVVPGMVDRDGETVVHAPALGWRDVPLRRPLASATSLPVQIENSGKACALSLMWSARGDANPPPYSPGRSAISRTASRYQPLVTHRFTNPGPATSARSTSALSVAAPAISSASSRGVRPRVGASRSATFVA